MGRMKKLYELTAEQDKPFLYFMHRTTQLTAACERVLEAIRTAEFLIGDFLEEGHPSDLEAAREFLKNSITILEGPNAHSPGLQAGNTDAQHHV